jgi:phage terminase large subunit GpA-like protein
LICESLEYGSWFTERSIAALLPADSVASWDWVCENGRMPNGKPFDGDVIPWCKGVCDAWDNPGVREIALQWGTRLGKTTISMQLIAKSADTRPMPGLFATSTQSLAKRTVKRKIYPMLSAVSSLSGQLPPEHLRTYEEIRLSSSPWAVAWSGSDTQLADLSAFYGYANEIDKWSMHEKLGGDAGEGDPLDQFEERFKEFPDAKIIFECSPSTKRRSRIEKKLLASNNCRYYVPCPKCGTFQVLKFGRVKQDEGSDEEGATVGGILFDRAPDGSVDPHHARETARYVCDSCRYGIHDDQRPKMMRAGIWCPEGQWVDKDGSIKGIARRGPRIWGGQLSSLYSLQLRWGDIAEKFARSYKHPEQLRMFINGWLAETWEPYKIKTEPEQVAERLTVDVPTGVIPKWATWLFAGVDVQDDHFVATVEACGPNERTHTVAHYRLETLAEVEEQIVFGKFKFEDSEAELSPAVTAIDCGFRTKEVYAFCTAMNLKLRGTGRKVVPIKGANTDCGGEPFEEKVIGQGNEGRSDRTKKALVAAGRGLIRLRVNPYYYEPILQDQIDEGIPGLPGSHSFHSEAITDLDFVRQVCNGAESSEPSKSDPNRHLWVKRWANEPNDFRDARKYARCIMDWHFKRNWRVAQQRQGGSSHPRQAPTESTGEEVRRERGRFRPQTRRERSRER